MIHAILLCRERTNMREKYYIEPLSGKKSDNEDELKQVEKHPIHGDITFVIEEGDNAIECIKDMTMGLLYINVRLPKDSITKPEVVEIVNRTVPSKLSLVNYEVKNYMVNNTTYRVANIILEGTSKSLIVVDIEELCDRLLTNLLNVARCS